MIIPTLWITRQPQDQTDVYGQPKLGTVTKEMVAPVKLIFTNVHTTVRTDSSGSHGSAYENTANIIFLASMRSPIQIGDIITICGNKVVVTMTHVRYRVTGVPDHIEVQCASWK
jgi:hypothetical protein